MQAIQNTTLSTPQKNYTWGNNPNWALRNISHGRNALISGASITAINVGKDFIDEESLLYKAASFLNSVLYGIRNHEQYSIYSNTEDDDLGEDLVKRPYSANVGKIACFIEQYVNPIAIPICFFIGEKAYNSYNTICHLPNALWWRSRLAEVKIQTKCFSLDYIKVLLEYFNKGTEYRKKAISSLTYVVSPILGLIGIGFVGLCTPLKSLNKFFGIENKIINSLGAIGHASQHAYYFLKFTMPEYFKIERNEENKNNILFSTGLSANILNMISPIIELIPDDFSIPGKIKKILLDLGTGCTMMFFSFRRFCMGREFFLEAASS